VDVSEGWKRRQPLRPFDKKKTKKAGEMERVFSSTGQTWKQAGRQVCGVVFGLGVVDGWKKVEVVAR